MKRRRNDEKRVGSEQTVGAGFAPRMKEDEHWEDGNGYLADFFFFFLALLALRLAGVSRET